MKLLLIYLFMRDATASDASARVQREDAAGGAVDTTTTDLLNSCDVLADKLRRPASQAS